MEKHFIFDLGNVLVDFNLDEVLDSVMASAGVSELPAGVRLQDTARVVEVETGKLSDEAYLADICQTTGLRLTLEHLIAAWQKGFHLNPVGTALFRELREQGRPVHILSNLAWHNMEAVRRNWPGFFDQSHENFFSYELGYHKPDERIYRAALDRLGANPSDCLFFDDKAENVEGARSAGMNAHIFSTDRIADIRREVENFSSDG
ncbi:HAD family hydrolase [Tichowtungia aerotolerans]|uniref:HAD-IA family hydrolase n=1 Tax=Tichowtungia aerotolerans TaxID=2697043 RepID=A0A6P1MG04_9BACT|nr:HAD family phosphatase [Tichowtungia aerotolerans]QHI70005.1 HAD-IA family hydrolase [Tichowtungia aerotolerans]